MCRYAGGRVDIGWQTCDQQFTGLNPGRHAAECNPGQVVYTHVPLLSSSIIWYRTVGSDAQQLGRQSRAWQKVMTVYQRGMASVTCRLTVKDWDQLWNPALISSTGLPLPMQITWILSPKSGIQHTKFWWASNPKTLVLFILPLRCKNSGILVSSPPVNEKQKQCVKNVYSSISILHSTAVPVGQSMPVNQPKTRLAAEMAATMYELPVEELLEVFLKTFWIT